MEADGLFVYGTLREGGIHHGWLQRTNPAGQCLAWAPGRLFHLPEAGLPAMVLGSGATALPPSSGWVRGDFIGYENPEELEQALCDLDQLKGVEEGLFERRICPVLLEGGQQFSGWIYIFPADRLPRLEKEALELPEGDWTPYLSA